jgi:hypothetical protein
MKTDYELGEWSLSVGIINDLLRENIEEKL